MLTAVGDPRQPRGQAPGLLILYSSSRRREEIVVSSTTTLPARANADCCEKSLTSPCTWTTNSLLLLEEEVGDSSDPSARTHADCCDEANFTLPS